MTSKEKAEYLVNEFYHNNTDYIDSNSAAKESAITCAIIHVDEVIKLGTNDEGIMAFNTTGDYNYLLQIREELENM